MIGELFTISVSNIVCAANSAVTSTLPADKPESIQLMPAEHGATINTGSANVILAEESVVGEILQVEDTAGCRQASQDDIDQLVSQLRATIAE